MATLYNYWYGLTSIKEALAGKPEKSYTASMRNTLLGGYMKKIAAALILVFTGFYLQAQTLTWDIEFRKIKTQETLEINRTIRMETGDEIRVTVTPANDCFAYILLYLDAEQKYAVGHNGTMKGGEGKALGIRLEDPPGTERLYVIMSLTRQARLESFIQVYNNTPNIQNRNNLLGEITSLQDTVSRLGERPGVIVPSGGTMRGGGEEIATRFSEKDLYVRAIAIRH